MSYYDMKNHKLLGFVRSETKNKMYDAILLSNDGDLINIPFGDKRFENYQDKTKLNLYPHLIHGDKERRKKYQARHKVYLKPGYYSPSYFSYYYLW